MKYTFKSREELVGMYNRIPTPHTHIINIEGNCLDIKWSYRELEGWSEYKLKAKAKKKDKK